MNSVVSNSEEDFLCTCKKSSESGTNLICHIKCVPDLLSDLCFCDSTNSLDLVKKNSNELNICKRYNSVDYFDLNKYPIKDDHDKEFRKCVAGSHENITGVVCNLRTNFTSDSYVGACIYKEETDSGVWADIPKKAIKGFLFDGTYSKASLPISYEFKLSENNFPSTLDDMMPLDDKSSDLSSFLKRKSDAARKANAFIRGIKNPNRPIDSQPKNIDDQSKSIDNQSKNQPKDDSCLQFTINLSNCTYIFIATLFFIGILAICRVIYTRCKKKQKKRKDDRLINQRVELEVVEQERNA